MTKPMSRQHRLIENRQQSAQCEQEGLDNLAYVVYGLLLGLLLIGSITTHAFVSAKVAHGADEMPPLMIEYYIPQVSR